MAAAEPILASSLWASPVKRRRLGTSLRSLDVALEGGFDYGNVCCISADLESGARDLEHAPETTATIIDTTISFDVKRLHGRLVESLQNRTPGKAAQEAIAVLDRLRIMKVFDFVGMTESIAELRDALEHRDDCSTDGSHPAPRGTVGDSEDEEEMLEGHPTPKKSTDPLTESTAKTQAADCGLLIIDNITQVVAPLLKNNHASGQALLASFMRSLSHLSKAHNLCTILLNHASTYNQAKDEAPSIFASCALRSALGKSFTYLVDVHVLVHPVPKTADDARAIYAGHSEPRSVERVHVLEVLNDRHGARVGRWAPFNTDEDGKLQEVALR